MKINEMTHYLLWAVDHEGEVNESFVTRRGTGRLRDREAALTRRASKRVSSESRFGGTAAPRQIVTDRLASDGAALKALGAVVKRGSAGV